MNRWAIPMDDGGVVEYDNSDRIVPIGNGRGVPERFSYYHPGGPDQPSFRIEFGVMNSIPVCVGVHIEAKDNVAVRTRDVGLVQIDKLIISGVAAVAFESRPSKKPGHTSWRKPHGDKAFNAASMGAATASVKGKPRTRRKPDDVDLQAVADTWRNAEPRSRTEALMSTFTWSRATAQRYKKKAMAEGYLDE